MSRTSNQASHKQLHRIRLSSLPRLHRLQCPARRQSQQRLLRLVVDRLKRPNPLGSRMKSACVRLRINPRGD